MSDMVFDACEKNKPLFETFIHSMKMVGRLKPIMEDTARKPVKFIAVFLKSFILGKLINRTIPDEKRVGIMIPTSNACAMVFLGLHAYGKIPAMLNFTSGPKQVIATCQTIGLKTVVTAKKVVALAKLENLVSALEEAGIRVAYLEDMASRAKAMGDLCGFCEYAEGWVRHNPNGFCPDDFDPLSVIARPAAK